MTTPDGGYVEPTPAGEKQLLEMIASGRSLTDVLQALCEFFEGATPGCLCTVYPIDWSGPTFRNVVARSLPASFLARLEGLPVGADVTPCGAAAQLRTQIIVEDIRVDPHWSETPCRHHLVAHDLPSVWATPIASLDGGVLGTFCAYRRTPATPSLDERDRIAQVTRLASIALDRERREAELKRSQTFLAQAQRLTHTGSFWWKPSTGEVIWSDENYRLLEYPLSVKPSVDLALARCHPDDLALVKEKISAAVTDGADADFEQRLLLPDGRVRHVRVVFQAMRVDASDFEFVGAATDITELKRAEETLGTLRSELAHATRVTSLGTLTASIAHEVNQPLAGIVTNASTCVRMLSADPPNVDGARETARRLIRDGIRAADVITRLRALFSRTSAAREVVDLNEAVREVVALARSDAQRAGAHMRLELSADRPRVLGDRVQLQQVMINLLRNAVEATRESGDPPNKIVVTTTHDQHRVYVSVCDTGRGLEPQSAGQLFDAFYTTKRDGMGIGLSVSRSIIESHGGSIWATPNEEHGVTFSFSLPDVEY